MISTRSSKAMRLLCGIAVCSGIALAPDSLASTGKATPRIVQRTYYSHSLRTDVDVSVLLPAAYFTHPERRFPTLFLTYDEDLSSMAASLSAAGIIGVEPHSNVDLIPIAPPRDNPGVSLRWSVNEELPNPAELGPQVAHNEVGTGPVETLSLARGAEANFVAELVPFIDASYRTIPDRAARGVIGFGGGGWSSVMLLARHPDLFSVAGAQSGPYTCRDFASGDAPDPGPAVCAVIQAELGGRDPFTDEIGWRSLDPQELATNLRGLPAFVGLAAGDGDPVELATQMSSAIFAQDLRRLHIPYTWTPLPGEGHEWHTAWMNRMFIPSASRFFSRHTRVGVPPPFRSTDRAFSVWGTDFAVDRGNTEFLTVRDLRRGGFTVEGTGTLEVVSSPSYPPRRAGLLSV